MFSSIPNFTLADTLGSTISFARFLANSADVLFGNICTRSPNLSNFKYVLPKLSNSILLIVSEVTLLTSVNLTGVSDNKLKPDLPPTIFKGKAKVLLPIKVLINLSTNCTSLVL